MSDKWNYGTKVFRKKLLAAAGYNPNAYMSRVFECLPSWVRLDVEYVFQRGAY